MPSKKGKPFPSRSLSPVYHLPVHDYIIPSVAYFRYPPYFPPELTAFKFQLEAHHQFCALLNCLRQFYTVLKLRCLSRLTGGSEKES